MVWRLRIVAAIVFGVLASPAALAQSPKYALVQSGDAIQDKTFYLLTLLAKDPTAHAALARDPTLRSITERSKAALNSALETCKQSTKCIVDAMALSDADRDRVADVLSGMAAPGATLNALVRSHMRPSGLFQRHAALDDAAFMRAAWVETASGLNRLYKIYALGEAPRYPAIDAISYPPEDTVFRSLLLAVLETALDEADDYDLFFQAWERVGLDLLLVNQRDEAVRFEPLAKGENRAAYERAAKLDWERYAYTAIVVPGSGLGDAERNLSASGALRVRLAVRRYNDGLAPFLVVSGGFVHPNKTPYAEAVEMKRELMETYSVPENAILIDPHARHTTTNLRNATRLLFRAGAPMASPVLITTSRGQSASIESDTFRKRCEDELGYQPQTLVRRLSPNDLVMTPNVMSLHADPRDPLDP
jgi:hypothetical protein